MKLYAFPSSRSLAVVALKNHLALDCEVQPIDLGRGDQLTPEYLAPNPNKKMPALEDDGFMLWESNAILFYFAGKRPDHGLWPSDLQGQADVLRWLAWESAHWDAESCGMVAYEKASKAVLGLGPPDPAFIARGEQNFSRFAAVLNNSLRGKTWHLGERLTIADFSVADSCLQQNGCSSRSETFPTSFAGTKGSLRCRLGKRQLQPEMRRWRHGS
jgi:glutathione S-transferase